MPSSAITKKLHGTCLRINGFGVLITGKPGSGKSLTALALLQRGHQLISDDLTHLTRHKNKIIATCPSSIHNLLFINQLGLLEVRQLFGNQAVAENATLDLVVTLEKKSVNPASFFEKSICLLGLHIPRRLIIRPSPKADTPRVDDF